MTFLGDDSLGKSLAAGAQTLSFRVSELRLSDKSCIHRHLVVEVVKATEVKAPATLDGYQANNAKVLDMPGTQCTVDS